LPGADEEVPDTGNYDGDDDAFPDPAGKEPVHASLHRDDPENFFKLSQFIKLIMAHSLTDDDVDKSETLIRSYCVQLIEVGVLIILPLLPKFFLALRPRGYAAQPSLCDVPS
jgi:hypothetical protein